MEKTGSENKRSAKSAALLSHVTSYHSKVASKCSSLRFFVFTASKVLFVVVLCEESFAQRTEK